MRRFAAMTLTLVVCLTAISCDRADPAAITVGSAVPTALTANAVVVNVVDGDTVRARIDGREERVRLLGIDTPETAPDQGLECYGPEATARTKDLLPEGTGVRLERDTEPRDRYDRLLAYVFRAGDGLFINEALVREGFADALWIAPNRAYRPEIDAARSEARAAQRGLWGACAAVASTS